MSDELNGDDGHSSSGSGSEGCSALQVPQLGGLIQQRYAESCGYFNVEQSRMAMYAAASGQPNLQLDVTAYQSIQPYGGQPGFGLTSSDTTRGVGGGQAETYQTFVQQMMFDANGYYNNRETP